MSFESDWDHEVLMRSDYSYRVQFEDADGVIRDPLHPEPPPIPTPEPMIDYEVEDEYGLWTGATFSSRDDAEGFIRDRGKEGVWAVVEVRL